MHVELDGARVEALRGDRGAGAFALGAGVSPTTLRRVERGRGPVELRTARKIAAALGTEAKALRRG